MTDHERMCESLAGAPDEVIDHLRAMYACGASNGDAYEEHLGRLRESRTGADSERETRELFERAGVPMTKRVLGEVSRQGRRSLADTQSDARLREAGIPVADEQVDERPVTAEDLAKGMQAAIDRVSPIPLTVPVDGDGLPDADAFRETFEVALDLAAAEEAKLAEFDGVPLTGGPSEAMVESAKRIREAAAARRRQTSGRNGRGRSR